MNEAELLFSEILNCDRPSLYLKKNYLLDKEKSVLISKVLKRRISAEPIQYILGKTEFMGLEFKVSPDVLIPRPETEILVETAICVARQYAGTPARGLNILDLGTGSGCIAISLAKLIPDAKISASDISQDALKISGLNAKLNNVNINFLQGDLFNAYGLKLKTFDLIVSNPPYIASSEIKKLQPEVQREPLIALDAGKDGLDFYKRIIRQARKYLSNEGFLIFEIGINQKYAVKKILQNSRYFEIIEVIKDYNKIDRVIVARVKV